MPPDHDALTPIQKIGAIWTKRDDLAHATGEDVPTGAKVRQFLKMAAAQPPGTPMVVGCSADSAMQVYVAYAAKITGTTAHIAVPKRKIPSPSTAYALDMGAEIDFVAPGYLSQCRSKAREISKSLGGCIRWNPQLALEDAAAQTANLPPDIRRIIIPCGSGLISRGIILGIARQKRENPPEIVLVAVSPLAKQEDITAALAKAEPDLHMPPWRMIAPETDYSTPDYSTLPDGTPLDPWYAAKAIKHVQEGDLLWIPAYRSTRASTPQPKKTTTMSKAPKTPEPPTPAPEAPTAKPDSMRPLTEPVIRCAYTRKEDPRKLRPHPRNPNEHPAEQIRLLLKIIDATGWRSPIVVSNRSGLITKGHGRLETALLGNFSTVPVDYQDYASDEEEIADVLADNLVADLAVMNRGNMQTLLAELTAAGYDTELAGLLKKQEDLATKQKKAAGALKERFIISPFTILDARGGDWMQRRNLWLQLGIESETGRNENLTFASSSQPPHVYQAKNNYETKIGRQCSWDEFFDQHPDQRGRQNGTSIFNPVLCEIMYNWFLPSKGSGRILDPFAGGSVRGIVAAVLGHAYTGIELRAEQVAANIANADAIFAVIGEPTHRPRWINGDSTKLDTLLTEAEKFDLVFTCPPYGDLEVYSDNPEDLSAQPEQRFRDNYTHIIKAAAKHLLPNRFSIWIIGDYRDKKTGVLRNFVNTTINAHPFPLYNHAVLLTAVSSLAIRIGKNFPKMRKLGKAHQDAVMLYNGDRINLEAAADAAFENVVMFLNGTASKIPDALGPIGAREIIPLGDILAQLTGAQDTTAPEQDIDQEGDSDAPVLDAEDDERDPKWEEETDNGSTTTLPPAEPQAAEPIDPATATNLPPLADDEEDDARP